MDALLGVRVRRRRTCDPATTDALGQPWWAGYAPRAPASGRAPAANRAGRSRRDRSRALRTIRASTSGTICPSREASTVAFHFTAHAPVVTRRAWSSRPATRSRSKRPAISELLFQLGSDPHRPPPRPGPRRAVRRRVGGRAPVPVAAFEDVLLGRSLAPVLEVSTQGDGRAVTVEAANRAPHASSVSRVANWVEVDVAPAHPADVQVGGFDRYEVYDARDAR